MNYVACSFNTLPRIGFAHHFQTENYTQKHRHTERSLEIVYVKDGDVHISCYGYSGVVSAGSLLLLFRDRPFSISAINSGLHRHCSLQLNFNYTATVIEDAAPLPLDFNGLLLPVLLPPCAETENIKKELYAIVSEIGISRNEREFSCAMAALGILSKIDRIGRRQAATESTTSLWEYKIKEYIARYIHKNITLGDIAAALQKTPNYLNSVFHEATGTSIHRYINGEKVKRIAEILENREMSFQDACAAVAITDVSYGYRLFKKHMGVTMRSYLSGERKQKNG